MATRDTLKVKGNSITGDELLSYIINYKYNNRYMLNILF